MQTVSAKTWTTLGIYRILMIALALFYLHTISSSSQLWFIIICALLLSAGMALWGFFDVDRRTILQALFWIVDVFILWMLLVKLSYPGTLAPSCLPLLAYEAEIYWPRRGPILGGIIAWLILVSTWWLRVWSNRDPWSITTVLFWSLFLFGFIALPFFLWSRKSVINPPIEPKLPIVGSDCLKGGNLTPREREVYSLISTGRSLRQISRELHVSYSTIKTHARHISEKLSSLQE